MSIIREHEMDSATSLILLLGGAKLGSAARYMMDHDFPRGSSFQQGDSEHGVDHWRLRARPQEWGLPRMVDSEG